MIHKLKFRFETWKQWRKYTSLGYFRQLLVLFGFDRSTNFENFTIFF